jgi:YihY family inner membrane protein
MSTATPVPETYGLDGETAVATLRRAKVGRLMRDSVARLRWADGFSHARAMAFQVVLAMIPGAIVLVAVATKLRWEALSTSIVRLTRSLAPGPASDVFADAFGQGAKAGHTGSGSAALVFGALALVISGATAYGQIERAANRIYGVEADRPTLRKYSLAAALMLTSGVLIVMGFLIIGLGQQWATHAEFHAFDTAWEIGRWPVAAIVLTVGFALIFKLSPRRRQPSLSWLAFGGLFGVLGAIVVSLLLHLYLRASSGFGETYGPLAGFIGVLLWAYLCCVALFLGLAFAAQLEAVRAGEGTPRSATKVIQSDPRSDPTTLGTDALGDPEPAFEGNVDREPAVVGAPGTH